MTTNPNDTPQDLGLKLLQLVQTKRDGASGNFDLADRCRRLLEDGASLAVTDANGMTPLMHAAIHFRTKIFNDLLQYGANVSITDNQGMTALDHAVKHKQKPAIAILATHEDMAEKKAFSNLGNMAVKKPVKGFRHPVRFRTPETKV